MRNLISRISYGVKIHQGDIILLIGVILISLLSFAAGYIAGTWPEKTPIQFEETQIYE